MPLRWCLPRRRRGMAPSRWRSRARFAAAPDAALPEDGSGMSADFEHLRWFDLPAACLN